MGRRPREAFSACMSDCCRRVWWASCFAATWAADKPPAPCPPPRRRFCCGAVSTAAGRGASAPPSTAAWTSSSLGGWRCQVRGIGDSQLKGSQLEQCTIVCPTAVASMRQPVQATCTQRISAGSLQGLLMRRGTGCGVQTGFCCAVRVRQGTC